MLHWDLKFESPSYIYQWKIGGLGQGWIVHNWFRSLSEFLPEILSLYQFGLNYRPYETLSYYPFIKLWPLDYIFILFLTCIPKFILIGCYFLLFCFLFFFVFFVFFFSVLIGCYLLSHPKLHVLLIILKYKNTQNLNVFYNWDSWSLII